MAPLDTVKKTEMKLGDLTIETRNVDIGRVIERLNRISRLKLDDFVGLSEGKFERTIGEMFSLIKNMETHLRHFIEFSESLKTESVDLKLAKENLAKENKELGKKLQQLENSVPLVKDLEKRLDLTVEEVEKFKTLYNTEQERAEKLRSDFDALTEMQKRIKGERDDAYKQIVVLENRLEPPSWMKEKKTLESRLDKMRKENERLSQERAAAKKAGEK